MAESYSAEEIEMIRVGREAGQIHGYHWGNDPDRWLATIDALQARLDAMRGKLSALVSAVERTDESSKGVFMLAHVHGQPYDGPNHGDELLAAKALLAEEGK